MAPSFSGVWNISTFYQYTSALPSPPVNGILAGGFNSGYANRADYQTINFNDGNGTDQGDLTLARYDIGGFGSTTRAVFAGGYGSSVTNVVDYVEYAALGNATDFGDMTIAASGHGAHSNNVRGLATGFKTASGVNTENKTIDYYTIASTGNASDFGDLSSNRNSAQGGGSSTRAIFFAGYAWGIGPVNIIDYVTIASAGNATDFGDASNSIYTHHANIDSSTRSIFFGGYTGSHIDVIEYVTIASTGNATDFGNLDQAQSARSAGLSNGTIGILAGDVGGNSANNQKITIASTGNATDFGTLQTYGGTYMAYQGSASPYNSAVQNEAGFPPAAMGLFFGGDYSTESNIEQTTISYIDIATTGSLAMFGDLSAPRDRMVGGFASSTRGGVMGGQGADNSTNVDIIEYVLFSTKGKATDFGNLTSATDNISSTSNSTRGLAAGGVVSSNTDTIEYITIASAGNATDFGNLLAAKQGVSATSGATRAIFAADTSGTYNVIQYVTIASAGNATDFGDLSDTRGSNTASASSTRAVFAGGVDGVSGNAENVIDYVTIASTGNATDFGDLTVTGYNLGGVSSGTRAVFGLRARDASTNVMDYITIASTGNATDWGDWWGSYTNEDTRASASNAHGGIA